MYLRSVLGQVLNSALEHGGYEKITSDLRLRLKSDSANLRTDRANIFNPDQYKADYQVLKTIIRLLRSAYTCRFGHEPV